MKYVFKPAAVLLTLMLLSSGIPVVLSSTSTGEAISQQNNVNQELRQDVLTEETIYKILDSITINDILFYMNKYVDEARIGYEYKEQFTASINTGLDELDSLGVTRDSSLLKAGRILDGSLLRSRGHVKYRWFMIGIFPVIVTISTIIPRVSFNITQVPTPIGNLTVRLELFIKTVPFIDFITIREPHLILPSITQSTRIWPAIGGRVTVQGVTLFILAYGPRIKWIREDALRR